MQRVCVFLLSFGLLVLTAYPGRAAEAATVTQFEPQTSSTRTEVPYYTALPATGMTEVTSAFFVASGIGFVGHAVMRRKQK